MEKEKKTKNVTEEMAPIMDKNEEKSEKTKKVLKIVWNFVFWTCLAVIVFIWVFDFVKVRNQKEPVFCLSKAVLDYEDGSVDQCTGLGYKVYKYKRKALSGATEFVPFWMSPREK